MGGGWNSLIVSEYVIYKEKVYSVRDRVALSRHLRLGRQKLVLLTLIAG
jgi:hypothetical protein